MIFSAGRLNSSSFLLSYSLTCARLGGGDFLLYNEPSLANRCPTADGMFGSDLVAAELHIC